MAKRNKIEWQFVVEDGGEMSQEEFTELISLFARIVVDHIQRDFEKHKTETKQPEKIETRSEIG
jgi:hypothetical protein